eukprot:5398657-Karenia_brevis.AAC.1
MELSRSSSCSAYNSGGDSAFSGGDVLLARGLEGSDRLPLELDGAATYGRKSATEPQRGGPALAPAL